MELNLFKSGFVIHNTKRIHVITKHLYVSNNLKINEEYSIQNNDANIESWLIYLIL